MGVIGDGWDGGRVEGAWEGGERVGRWVWRGGEEYRTASHRKVKQRGIETPVILNSSCEISLCLRRELKVYEMPKNRIFDRLLEIPPIAPARSQGCASFQENGAFWQLSPPPPPIPGNWTLAS